MPDITTQPDQVAAYLAGVRERFAGVEQCRHLYVRWAADLERTGGGTEYAWMARSLLDVPRLLGAVEAALALAEDWKATGPAPRPADEIQRRECARDLLATITAELYKESSGG